MPANGRWDLTRRLLKKLTRTYATVSIAESLPSGNIHIDIDIFVNCKWVDTRWQQCSTQLHTNNTKNNTINLGRVLAVPRLCQLCPGICLTAGDKARENLSQGSRRVPAGAMKTECTEQNIHNKYK